MCCCLLCVAHPLSNSLGEALCDLQSKHPRGITGAQKPQAGTPFPLARLEEAASCSLPFLPHAPSCVQPPAKAEQVGHNMLATLSCCWVAVCFVGTWLNRMTANRQVLLLEAQPGHTTYLFQQLEGHFLCCSVLQLVCSAVCAVLMPAMLMLVLLMVVTLVGAGPSGLCCFLLGALLLRLRCCFAVPGPCCAAVPWACRL